MSKMNFETRRKLIERRNRLYEVRDAINVLKNANRKVEESEKIHNEICEISDAFKDAEPPRFKSIRHAFDEIKKSNKELFVDALEGGESWEGETIAWTSTTISNAIHFIMSKLVKDGYEF